ncbi:Rgp1-domain-containing protein [Clavulina sp. PMI_390]|nr:Rgp1-domain-containing protein [Clavulina sp. PMI_390]
MSLGVGAQNAPTRGDLEHISNNNLLGAERRSKGQRPLVCPTASCTLPNLQQMGDTQGIAITVSPAQSAFFAGEDFAVTITFANLNEPSTSFSHLPPHVASAFVSRSGSPSISNQPNGRAQGHRRGVQSVSINGPKTSASSSFPNLSLSINADDIPASAQTHSADGRALPRRNGLIGRDKGKQRADSIDLLSPSTTFGEPASEPASAVTVMPPDSPTNRFKKKHAPKSLSVSTIPSSAVTASERLPKLDTGQGISPLPDYKYRSPVSATSSTSSPITPRVHSANAIPKTHPHARKHSLFDDQSTAEDLPTPPANRNQTSSNYVSSPLAMSNPTKTPLANGTANTPQVVGLNSIRENATPIPYASPMRPVTPSNSSPMLPPPPPPKRIPNGLQTEDLFEPAQGQIPHSPARPTGPTTYKGSHSRRRSSVQFPPEGPSSLASLLPSSPIVNATPRSVSLTMSPTSPTTTPRSPLSLSLAQTLSPPGTEVVLWAYARLVGTLELDESIIPPAEIDSLRAKLRGGGAGSGVVVGGGRMDIAERAPGSSGGSGSGSGFGILSSLFGSGSGSASPSSGAAASQGHGSGSYLSSFFGGGGSGSGSTQGGLARSRSVSMNGRYASNVPFAGASGGSMFGGSAGDDPSLLPTLELQPSVLAVDLSLAPGEKRSFKYSLPLPSNLPPTYRGSAFKFTYTLLVGTSRASTGPSNFSNLSSISLPSPGPQAYPSPLQQQQENSRRSRVLKVPVRVYNHVSAGRSPAPYDLLWPVGRRREVARRGRQGKGRYGGAVVVDLNAPKPPPLLPPPRRANIISSSPISHSPISMPDRKSSISNTLPPSTLASSGASIISEEPSAAWKTLRDYGAGLLLGSSSTSTNGTTSERSSVDASDDDHEHHDHDEETHDNSDHEGKVDSMNGSRGVSRDRMSCREAVEVLTRNPKRMSYDIEKDGAKVAVLTFVKSAYRLGETILGVVDLNFGATGESEEVEGRTKVLKLFATLETHESLPPTIPLSLRTSQANLSASTNMKRIHSEFLTTQTAHSSRIAFALDVPADATPAFAMTAYDPYEGKGGVTWRVRLRMLVAVVPSELDHAISPSHVARDNEVMRLLERDAPRGEWGETWAARSSLAPLGRISLAQPGDPATAASSSFPAAAAQNSSGWGSMFFGSSSNGSSSHTTGYTSSSSSTPSSNTSREDYFVDSDDNEDGDLEPGDGEASQMRKERHKARYRWDQLEVQTVECQVPVAVWPGATVFRPRESVFDC